eukprot:336381-Hanusia_phi.AAC.1
MAECTAASGSGRRVENMAGKKSCSVLPLLFAFSQILLSEPINGLSKFDPANCNQTNPCCTSADVVSALIGSTSKSFCKIEW